MIKLIDLPQQIEIEKGILLKKFPELRDNPQMNMLFMDSTNKHIEKYIEMFKYGGLDIKNITQGISPIYTRDYPEGKELIKKLELKDKSGSYQKAFGYPHQFFICGDKINSKENLLALFGKIGEGEVFAAIFNIFCSDYGMAKNLEVQSSSKAYIFTANDRKIGTAFRTFPGGFEYKYQVINEKDFLHKVNLEEKTIQKV